MKTPTLKQVQEHFKYANVIMVNGINYPFLGDSFDIKFLYNKWMVDFNGNNITIWNKENGYARITDYRPNDKSNEIGIPIMKTILDKLANTQRPITKHKHTQGEWKVRFMNTDGSGDDNGECDFFVEAKELKSQIGKIEIMMEDFGEHSGYPREQKLADAKLIRIAPQLLQIAEMYFDSMKGTDAEGSIPFNLTLETLNKLK